VIWAQQTEKAGETMIGPQRDCRYSFLSITYNSTSSFHACTHHPFSGGGRKLAAAAAVDNKKRHDCHHDDDRSKGLNCFEWASSLDDAICTLSINIMVRS